MRSIPLEICIIITASAWAQSFLRETVISLCDSTNLTQNAFSLAPFAVPISASLAFCTERLGFRFILDRLRLFFASVTIGFERSVPTPTSSPR